MRLLAFTLQMRHDGVESFDCAYPDIQSNTIHSGCKGRTLENASVNNESMQAKGVWLRICTVLGAAIAALFLSFSLVMPASPAYAAEVDPQTQAALEELEQAFTEAYEQSQGANDMTGDMASSLDDEGGEQESIADDDTPLAAAPSAAAEEEIADEENPLAANPYASPVHDFAWVLLVVIVAVAAFFLISTRRLDRNINQMRRFVD